MRFKLNYVLRKAIFITFIILVFPAHIIRNALKYKSFSVEKNGLPIASAMEKKAKLFIVCKLHALLDGNRIHFTEIKNTFVFCVSMSNAHECFFMVLQTIYSNLIHCRSGYLEQN